MDPVADYDALVAANSVVVLIYFRGHWCPFCMSYLRQLQKLTSSIEEAGGKVVVVTAESGQDVATRSASGYQGRLISDPEHKLATELRQRGLVDVAVSDKKGYPHGMTQPAILATTPAGEVLYKWECVPSMMNLGGAKDRPDLTQMWDSVNAQLKGGQAKVVDEKSFGFLSMLLGRA